MKDKKNIFVIIGSASDNSLNEKLIDHISNLTSDFFRLTIYKSLKTLPHFNPELSANNPPESIIELRNNIDKAEGVIICTPEYIFSIPSGLKNAIEWCVATTVFNDKPTGIITASASGQHGQEELKLIMNTVMAKFNNQTTLLIPGIKGKINQQGQITDSHTTNQLTQFINAFKDLVFDK